MRAESQKLRQLLALAGHGGAGRAVLLEALAELLLDWPAHWTQGLREPVSTLFAAMARDADAAFRARFAARLSGHAVLPLALLNAFYFDAPPDIRREILARNDGPGEVSIVRPDAAVLLAAACLDNYHDFAGTLADVLWIAPAIARAALADPSGEALAVLCRGAGLDRSTFSALSLLKGAPGDAFARLAVYDNVPPRAAARLVGHWRKAAPRPSPGLMAAE